MTLTIQLKVLEDPEQADTPDLEAMIHDMVPEEYDEMLAEDFDFEPFYPISLSLPTPKRKQSYVFKPAYGFGKRSPDFHFKIGNPYQYHSKFMGNPYG